MSDNTGGELSLDAPTPSGIAGLPPLSRCLGALSEQLRLFIDQARSCEKSRGKIRLRDATDDDIEGMQVVWDRVVMLAVCCAAILNVPPISPAQQARLNKDGILVCEEITPRPNARPLSGVLKRIVRAILYRSKDSRFPLDMPVAMLEKLTALADAVDRHTKICERAAQVQEPSRPTDLISCAEAAEAVNKDRKTIVRWAKGENKTAVVRLTAYPGESGTLLVSKAELLTKLPRLSMRNRQRGVQSTRKLRLK